MEEACIEKKIYYHDTDCGGVVYYANYLKYLEEARTEFFTAMGIDLKRLSEKGIIFVVAKVEISYKSPARYQDIIRVHTRIERAKMSAMLFSQRVTKDGSLVAEATTTLVCVGAALKPIPIPDEIKKILSHPA